MITFSTVKIKSIVNLWDIKGYGKIENVGKNQGKSGNFEVKKEWQPCRANVG